MNRDVYELGDTVRLMCGLVVVISSVNLSQGSYIANVDDKFEIEFSSADVDTKVVT